MLPLANYDMWEPRLDEYARRFLNGKEWADYQAMAAHERRCQLQRLLDLPVAQFSWVNEVVFRTLWGSVLASTLPGSNPSVLEIASGAEDCIPQAMARTHPHGQYAAANMNKQLTAGLLRNTKELSLPIRVIEDDAANMSSHLGTESVDLVAFHHGVNDVLQAIRCDQEGIDTVDSDWMRTLPRMIELLRADVDQGTFEDKVKGPFLGLLTTLRDLLRPGGTMVMLHFPFQMDLDWGYPPDLYEGIIPMTRRWAEEIEGLTVIDEPGYPDQWWLFLRKIR